MYAIDKKKRLFTATAATIAREFYGHTNIWKLGFLRTQNPIVAHRIIYQFDFFVCVFVSFAWKRLH